MNLSTLLAARAAKGRPVRVGLIGAGKFGSMVLAQAQRIPGYHMVAVADLNVGKARESLDRVGWPKERYRRERREAVKNGTTFVTDDVRRCSPATRSNASSRRPAIRSPAPAMRWLRSSQQARRHGQCRGRRHGRADPG